MGSILSQLRLALQTLKSIADAYETLSKRISLTPGIPQLNSSVPYWTIPSSPIAQHGQDTDLPIHADVVIIGSGITGTSIAKTLMEYKHENTIGPLKVVMLEARDACSGATGRNGGHMSPNIYNEYSQLKETHGASSALQIIEFRLAHIPTLISAAKEENLAAESQARVVEEFDIFMHDALFKNAKGELDTFLKEAEKERKNFKVFEDRESIAKLQLSSAVAGCIAKPGGAIHPYRFVTGILSNLLIRYSNFQLFTRTPCTKIVISGDTHYIITTPRGELRASHVIHATNAWSSHLLPGMRRKIIPTRLHMSAQRPGQGLMGHKGLSSRRLESWTGKRAFVFYPGKSQFAFDYLTQLPPSPASHHETKNLHYPESSGEFMFGGGAMLGGRAESALFDNVGVVDDGKSDLEVEAYLGGVLERYFSDWGQEGNDADSTGTPDGLWGKGRMKASWTGIMGMSADWQPWVGRVPPRISGRREPAMSGTPEKRDRPMDSAANKVMVAPGEWIAAGFSGEGMVHAWLSGQSLAHMVLGVGGDNGMVELPPSFLITVKRWKEAKIEDLMQGIAS